MPFRVARIWGGGNLGQVAQDGLFIDEGTSREGGKEGGREGERKGQKEKVGMSIK